MFLTMMPHLQKFQVRRQTDEEFIQVIRKVSTGDIDESTDDFMNNLDRPIQDESEAMHIFATNDWYDPTGHWGHIHH